MTVTGSQTEIGKSDNVPSDAKIVDADGNDVTAGYTITYVNGTLEVLRRTNAHVTLDKTVINTPANNVQYGPGEIIQYSIKVTNDGDQPVKNIEVKDELTGDKWTIDKLEVGESQTFYLNYTVTNGDILKGYVVNTVVGSGDGTDIPDATVTPGKTITKTGDYVIPLGTTAAANNVGDCFE